MKVRHSVQAALVFTGLASIASAQAPVFPAPVEAWRTRIDTASAGMGIPIEFLLTWVQFESYGNPCSVGIPKVEAGIAQTYHPDDDRFGATFDELRAACVEGTQELARPLTEDEKDLQVKSLVGLVKGARDGARGNMARAGVTWSESSPDFWKLVKLRHALPAFAGDYLVPCAADLGHPPATWAEFREWVEGLSDERVISINQHVRPWASLAQRQRLFNAADKTGRVVVPPSSPAPVVQPTAGGTDQ